jgi:D-sedoheptulose 7-phosphate isomerase
MSKRLENMFCLNPELNSIKTNILKFTDALYETAVQRKTIFICGNGGSAADSEHIAGEFLKSFLITRECDSITKNKLMESFGEEGLQIASKIENGIKAVPIVGFSSFLSAYGNDKDWTMGYAQFIHVMGESGDILLGISTSGNAQNVNNAFKVALIKGMKRLLLTGAKDGICNKNADIIIQAPADETFKIQEYHVKIYHSICAEIEERIFKV